MIPPKCQIHPRLWHQGHPKDKGDTRACGKKETCCEKETGVSAGGRQIKSADNANRPTNGAAGAKCNVRLAERVRSDLPSAHLHPSFFENTR